jgi:DNA-binding CsgD family transcriptional regulator
MLEVLGKDIENALGGGEAQASLFPLVLRGLSDRPDPTLIVIEDAHWADEATLDLLRYLARRIERVRALLLVTYRNDEVGPRHPLRRTLGDLASTPAVHRMSLSPLSRESVEELASGSGLDPELIYKQTGGNPFFVTEVLATDTADVPATVADAVLARASRLSPAARPMLEAVAIVGPRVEVSLLSEMVHRSRDETITALAEAIHTGILQADDDVVMFRHELAREAILKTLSGLQRTALHARALDLLRRPGAPPASPSRLAHHAEAAGDNDATLEYALVAALNAASLSAHREALAQYERALRAADTLPDEQRVAMLEEAAFEAYLGGNFATAVDLRRGAVDARREMGDLLATGRNLTHMTCALSTSGRAPEAREAVHQAIEVLESLELGADLAMAYSYLSQLLMLAGENREAIERGQHAIRLAKCIDAPIPLLHALNNVGMARVKTGDPGGFADMERSLRLAREHHMDDEVARAYVNLSGAAIRRFDFETTARLATDGIKFCIDRDLQGYRLFLASRLAHVLLYRGLWSDAEGTFRDAIGEWGSDVGPETAYIILHLIHARRGEHGADDALRRILAKSAEIGHAAFTGLLHIAHAESAWLTSNEDDVLDEVRAQIDHFVTLGEADFYGPLAAWLRIIGGPESFPRDLPRLTPPYSLMVAGEWPQAAAAWEALGCPYETALCLLQADDEPSLRRALALFEDLGAYPAASKAIRRLQAIGARNIARGPRKSTRATPGKLTTRELEVFQLLAAGLSNNDIAERLFLSPNTVGHHVSAILAKLGARSRSEAVAIGNRMGLDSQAPHS